MSTEGITTDTPAGLLEYLDFRDGRFVEAGAHDGHFLSNTLGLEADLEWTGLLIEPVPELAAQCQENRPSAIVEQVALVGPSHSTPTIPLLYGGSMSVVRGARETPAAELDYVATRRAHDPGIQRPYELTVPATTLSALLDRHEMPKCDLLSLDVEGYELQALEGLDLNRHRPKYVLVETWWVDSNRHRQVPPQSLRAGRCA